MVAGGMLALAIGITSAMLTIVDHMLLRPVPYHDPAALVCVCMGHGASRDAAVCHSRRCARLAGESGIHRLSRAWFSSRR